MNGSLFIAWLSAVSESFLLVLLGSSLKASLVFAVVFVAARLMRASHPSLRHLLWLGAIASYLWILLLSLLGPTLLRVPLAYASAPGELSGTVSSVLLGPAEGMGFAAAESPAVALGRTSLWEPLWAFPLFIVWTGGLMACLASITAGGIRMRLLAVQARRSQRDPRLERLSGELEAAIGIRRRVQVLKSPVCRVPYTAGILRPRIMLPSSERAWPVERLRAVLLHELRHIKRWDFLTQAASRLVCSVFWFVPLVWIAYSFLYEEQEKTCDADVADRGVAPRDYAACLLYAARSCPRPAAFAGLYSPVWRRRILEERIHAVVDRVRAAKKPWLVFALIAGVVCGLVMLSGASGKETLSTEEAYRRFIGRWVNEVYPGSLDQPEVRLIQSNHVGQDMTYVWQTVPEGVWTIRIRKAWGDFRGNTYCKFSWNYIQGWRAGEDRRKGVGVMRVNRAGNILEATVRCGGEQIYCSDRIDLEARQWWNRYWIYYRQ